MEEKTMNAREMLIYVALKFNGDYKKFRDFIANHKTIEEEFGESDPQLPNFNSKAITILDDEYPEQLKNCWCPPIVLFYHGDISLLKELSRAVAVIGTRKPTEYGVWATKRIVSEIDKDAVIVSGLAKGIDAVAHAQCLEDKGKTIAVLGSGINYCYPEENKELYDAIIKGKGLIISEYPDKTVPSSENFPFRNRLINALSLGVLVTEAFARSGTSITVSWALSANKPVFAVPHQIGRYSFCNELINDGAEMIENGETILEYLKIKKDAPIFEM